MKEKEKMDKKCNICVYPEGWGWASRQSVCVWNKTGHKTERGKILIS
jgi:hypothetical protein